VLVSKDSICAGDSTTLIASGGGAYVWTNNSSTSSSITVKPSGNTTYSLVTTFNGKCAVDTTINIAVTPYPVVNVIWRHGLPRPMHTSYSIKQRKWKFFFVEQWV